MCTVHVLLQCHNAVRALLRLAPYSMPINRPESNFSFAFQVPMVTTESGLQYKDIKVGEGPSPPIGFQVLTLNWNVLMRFMSLNLFLLTMH